MEEGVLGAAHLKLIEDLTYVRLKQEAMSGIVELFDAFAVDLSRMSMDFSSQMPFLVDSRHQKISRGENYKGMPYLILDYPRIFDGEDVFAFRSMFLWGHFFSFSFQLSGIYLERYRLQLEERLHTLQNKDYYYCIHETPWEYTYHPENYISLERYLLEKENGVFSARPFVKISRKINLAEWKKVSPMGCETFADCLGLIKP